MRQWKIPLFELDYTRRELRAARGVVRSKWLTTGEKTREFETKFATRISDSVSAVAVSNCTAALHLALLALGVGPGDEVCVPAMTFVADANVVALTGAKPVFLDSVSLDDPTVNPKDFSAKITPRTKAVIVVHYAGFAADLSTVSEICDTENIAMVEDVAHGPFATFGGQSLGTFGDLACFSFFGNKNLVTGEGGMVVSSRADLMEKVERLRSHGMTTLSYDRYKGRAVSYDVETPGLNYRTDEVRSALGLVQLSRMDEMQERRSSAYERYLDLLEEHEVPVAVPFRQWQRGRSAYHVFPVVLPSNASRSAVIKRMKEDGIQTSVHYPAIPSFSAYSGWGTERTPVARAYGERVLTLPFFPRIRPSQQKLVITSLLGAVRAAAERS